MEQVPKKLDINRLMEEYVEENYSRLLAYTKFKGLSYDDAQEVVQEALLRLQRRLRDDDDDLLKSLNGLTESEQRSRISSLMVGFIRYVVLEKHRTIAKLRERETSDINLDEIQSDHTDTQIYEEIYKNQFDTLEKVIAEKLTPLEQKLVSLIYFLEKPSKQIAEELEIDATNLRKMRYTLMQKIRREIELAN